MYLYEVGVGRQRLEPLRTTEQDPQRRRLPLQERDVERVVPVAGVQDARFQELMPDTLHWLGIRRIDRFVSMSNMKYNAIVNSGIEIGERVPIPPELIPADAQVEIEAKKAAGYYAPEPTASDLSLVKGRDL